jgi:hypothetical protein
LINLLDPKPEQIHIGDIAHQLSMICRFSGATRKFYSVAEHSINVAKITKSLNGLLHDASEAYLQDINGNLKKFLPDYKAVEKRFEAVIQEKFGVEPLLEYGKAADAIMLQVEGRYLIKGWQNYRKNKAVWQLQCWPPTRAKLEFLKEFEKLFLEKNKSLENKQELDIRNLLTT